MGGKTISLSLRTIGPTHDRIKGAGTQVRSVENVIEITRSGLHDPQ